MSEYDKPLQSNTAEYDDAMTPRPAEQNRRNESARTAAPKDARNVIRDGSDGNPMNHTE